MGPLPNGTLSEEENWELGFRALDLSKHDSWGSTLWEQFKAFQSLTRTRSLIHRPYSLRSFFLLAGKQPPKKYSKTC